MTDVLASLKPGLTGSQLGGTFPSKQARIYDIVLATQNAAIDAERQGMTVREIHEIARAVIQGAG